MGGLDVNILPREDLTGVLRQAFIEHTQHLRRDVEHRDFHEFLYLGIQLRHILMHQITELRRELHARRPTSYHREIQYLPPQCIVGGRQRGDLKALQDPLTYPPRITHILQEERVLSNARRAEGLAIATHRHDELIVAQIEHLPLPLLAALLLRLLARRIILVAIRRRHLGLFRIHHALFQCHRLPAEIHIVGPRLHEFHVRVLPVADRLEDGPELLGAYGAAG